jgi:hypothetical protein
VDGADGGEGDRVHGFHFGTEKAGLKLKKGQKFDVCCLIAGTWLGPTRRDTPVFISDP